MKKGNIIIAFAALFVFLTVGFFTQIFRSYFLQGFMQTSDTWSYYSAAINFFHHFKADPMRTLGYPVLIGIPLIFNAGTDTLYLWAIFLNLVAWILTSLFIFNTLILVTKKNISILTTAIFIMCVGNIEYVYLVLSETIYTCLITGVVYFIVVYFLRKKINSLAWAFLLFSVSLLIRPTLWPIYPFVIGIVVYVGVKSIRLFQRKAIFYYFLIFFMGLGLISFQLRMMKRDFGEYTISFNGEKTLYEYLGSYASHLGDKTDFKTEKDKRLITMIKCINGGQWKKMDSICGADLKYQLKNNTGNLCKALKIDIAANTFEPGFFNISNISKWFFFDAVKNACIWLSYWQNVLFTGFCFISIGLIIILRKKLGIEKAKIALINWGIAMLIIFISAISFWQLNRFHIVFTPLVLINVALLLDAVIRRTSKL